MIEHAEVLESFEQKQLSREKFSYPEKLRIFEALYNEALSLKVFPPNNDALRDLEHTYRLARFLNHSTVS